MKVTTRPGFETAPASTAVRTAMRTAASTSTTTPVTTASASTTPAATITIAPVSILVSRDSWRKVELLAGTYREEPAEFLRELIEVIAAAPPDVLMDAISEVARQTAIYHGRLATVARL